MRRLLQPVAFVCCVCLVGLQLSGVHMHAGPDGLDATPHGTHVHGAGRHVHEAGVRAASRETPRRAETPREDDAEHHDHSDYRDVAIVELAAGAAKVPIFLIGAGLEVPAARPGTVRVRDAMRARPPSAPEAHRRPPLRGPPRLSV